MQERMKALGGEMLIESTPGAGTRMIAHCTRLGIERNVTTTEPINGEKQKATHGKAK